jgi:hypothetical protein
LSNLLAQPLGGATKDQKLLATLRELARYKPNTAELQSAAPLVKIITRMSVTERNPNVKVWCSVLTQEYSLEDAVGSHAC